MTRERHGLLIVVEPIDPQQKGRLFRMGMYNRGTEHGIRIDVNQDGFYYIKNSYLDEPHHVALYFSPDGNVLRNVNFNCGL